MIEGLERRTLLSGELNGDDYFLIDQSGDVPDPVGGGNVIVDVAGTAGDDLIQLYVVGAGLWFSVNGNATPVYADSRIHILGNRGNDVIYVHPTVFSRNVTIYGGAGDDTIFAGLGNDRVYAGEGSDEVNGAGGNDTIYGELGDDSVRGSGGSDNLDGGEGADTLRGDAGNDRLVGGVNPDRLRGSLGNDTLEGGGGRDLIGGEDGDDSLDGGGGPDVVDGGAGADVLRGGDGQDQVTIVFGETDDYDYAEVLGGEVLQSSTSSSGIPKVRVLDDGVFNGDMFKQGAATLTFTGAGQYNGSTTITGGTLQVAADATPDALTSDVVYVKYGATLMISAADFERPNMTVGVEEGGVLAFGNSAASATLAGLYVIAGGAIEFNLARGENNQVHITNAYGVSANNGIIRINPAADLASGSYTLVTFPPGGNQTIQFTLEAVADSKRAYTLNVDREAGTVIVDVVHV